MSDPIKVMCPILTAEVMKMAFDKAESKRDRCEVIGSINNHSEMVIMCRRECGMWNQCHNNGIVKHIEDI